MATKLTSFYMVPSQLKMARKLDFGRMSGLVILRFENNIQLCTTLIARHKGATIAKVLASFPQNVMFRRDLVGPRLASWNALLQHLVLI
jgi:hypothetical protein